MKNIKRLILFALIGMFSFAQSASGQTIDSADTTRESTRVALSPYAQSVPNESYTFIGVSHPSLDTALTQIGLVVEAVGMNTSQGTASSRSAVFTVNAGETHRVFVVNASHSTINDQNAAFTDSRTHLIPTSNSAQFGSIRVTTVSKFPTTATSVGSGDSATKKFENLAQLSMWGIVYFEASGAGFAMEFVGDMADSTVGGQYAGASKSIQSVSSSTSLPTGIAITKRAGAGIN